MLIHKMKKIDPSNPNKWSNGNKGVWPSSANPFVISNQTPKPSSSSVVTADDLKKIAKAKKYRSIDDPWEAGT